MSVREIWMSADRWDRTTGTLIALAFIGWTAVWVVTGAAWILFASIPTVLVILGVMVPLGHRFGFKT